MTSRVRVGFLVTCLVDLMRPSVGFAALRLSLFFKEVYDKIGSEIHVRIGDVIPYEKLEKIDRKRLMEHLRGLTYALGAGMPQVAIRGRGPSRRPKAGKPR